MSTVPAVGCAGMGRWGANLARNLESLGALAWICEPDAGRRDAAAARHPGVRVTGDFDEMLADPGLAGVVIASPAETHGGLVRQALLAGKDVFVEKPLCLTLAEGRHLCALAASGERVLMVGHLLWYHAAVLELKRIVDSGGLGRIQYIYSNRLNLGRIRREENILWSFAPHDISVILGLVDEMPSDIRTQAGYYLHDRIADLTVTLLSFPSGIKAHIFVSWLHPFKEQKLVVVGTRRMAVFDDLDPDHKLRLYPHTIDWRNHVPVASEAPAECVDVDLVEPLHAECAHFLECIRTRAVPRTGGAEALRVLEVLEWSQRELDADTRHPQRPAARNNHFVHESAYVETGVEIGHGTKVWHFAHLREGTRIGADCRIGQNVMIGPNVSVGDGVKIQNNVSVYEGVTLEDHVFCGPSVVFTNVYNPRSEVPRMDELRPTLVRRGATLGANCTILCGVIIGRYAFIGAGAVVLRDVPDFALVVGNPGRIAGWVCRCGSRIEFGAGDERGACVACGARYGRHPDGVQPERVASIHGD